MNKERFIERLHRNNYKDISRKQLSKMANALIADLGDIVADGKRVEIRGFGVLGLRVLGSKVSCNPKTRERFYIAKRYKFYFRPAKKLRERVIDVDALPRQTKS